MAVGNNLKLLRKQFGKSQDDVSKSLGLNRSTYSGYENSVAQPSLEIISMISDYYNISVDAILKNDFSSFSPSQWSKLSNSWKSSATGSKLRVLTAQVSEKNDELIEMIPIKARAGYALGYSDPEFIKELPTIRLPFLSKNRKYRTFPISGDSMPPVSDGSFVVAEFVQDWTSIASDIPCILVTKDEGIVFKIIENQIKKDKTVLLTSTNPLYEPYSVELKDIHEIWIFRCYISMELPDPAIGDDDLSSSIRAIQKSLHRIERKR
jgi:transcriptional regulator with XRE-family HTH domain